MLFEARLENTTHLPERFVPRISAFFGVAIYVHWRDHGPPHFHAVYGGEQLRVGIDDLSVLTGRLPPRVVGFVVEWAALHQEELREVWRQAQNLERLDEIEPLR